MNKMKQELSNDQVVVSRQEFEELRNRAESVYNQMNERMQEELKIERRMTAQKVLLKVKDFLDMQSKTMRYELKIVSDNCKECYLASQENRYREIERIAKEFDLNLEKELVDSFKLSSLKTEQ